MSARSAPVPASPSVRFSDDADADDVRANLAVTTNAALALGMFGNTSTAPPAPAPAPADLGGGSGTHGARLEPKAAFNTRLGNLYSAYWRMLDAAVAALQDLRTLGPQLADSVPMRTFTELTAVKAPPAAPDVAGLAGMKAAFAQLPPTAQNMLLALVDVNMRLTAQEAQLHALMSTAYERAAHDASACVAQAVESALGSDAQQAERVAALHAQAVQALLGTKYAWLTTGTAQMAQRAAALGIDAPSGASAQDPAEAVLKTLQHLKRSIGAALALPPPPPPPPQQQQQAARQTPHGGTAAATAAAAADARLALRMEKHALASRKAAEIARLRHDALELAQVLRYFAAAEEELNVALTSAVAAPPPAASAERAAADAAAPPARAAVRDDDDDGREGERRAELAAMLPVVSDLTDQAHIIAAEAAQLRVSLQRQVREEVSAEREVARSTATSRLAALQQQLARTQALALEQHEAAVAAATAAERTLAAELAQCAASAPLQVCMRAVGEAAHAQRHYRDASALAAHKADLHKIAVGLRARLLGHARGGPARGRS